jgi:hypothetical protein
MTTPTDVRHNANLASLLQQYQTNAELLLKHQLDSHEKDKETLAISERIAQLTAQVIVERYKLDGVEKEVSKERNIIDDICSDMKKSKVSALLTDLH